MNPNSVDTLIKIVIPCADVLTPNIPEVEKIANMKINCTDDMKTAAKIIYEMGCKNVIVKGGHAIENALDILYDGKQFYNFQTHRINTKNTHGTGCTFSSAIASNLALGFSIPQAIEQAKKYITTAIEHSLPIGKGNGPTHHFYNLYENGLFKGTNEK